MYQIHALAANVTHTKKTILVGPITFYVTVVYMPKDRYRSDVAYKKMIKHVPLSSNYASLKH